MALNNQALYMSALGRVEEALGAVSQAVDIKTALAEKRPAVHQQDLEHYLRLLEDLRKRGADQK
ncbi:hypothetical protein Q8791_10210 [Nocardiopsis sp. CT-R113]|uniref:Uncharacterized protein n=1 Tax=Nocardiopsis codii TaxID=3065942 RepID=A0ABU7K5S2_9ACTN|nr:hypothetical protein [Nocardiopsis sp. CT-R113]MEE2037592.1 hypothetical protein [Nocardiopsis sp. CT-R113]